MPTDRHLSPIRITLNGQTIHAPADSTILDAAQQAGVEIPTICYHPNLTANAVCRLCTVEVVGSRISTVSRGLFRIVGRVLRLN